MPRRHPASGYSCIWSPPITNDPKRALVDRDRLANADRTDVARSTVAIFNTLDGKPKAHQLLAICAAFLLMVEAARLPIQDAFVFAKNLMWDRVHADRMEARFAGMKFHLETELLSDEE